MTRLQAALSLAEEHGIPVFPCLERDVRIGDKLRKAKSPWVEHGFKDASTNVEQIAQWWDQHPDALVGVPTGERTHLLVLDIDQQGAQWYRENADRLGCGRVHRTPRGHHLLYRMPRMPIRGSASKLAPGVDVRGDGGYFVWWAGPGFPATGELEELTEPPAWLLEAILATQWGKTNGADRAQERAGGTGIPEGSRNATLTSFAGRMRYAGASQGEIEVALEVLNGRCEPPLQANELHNIANSVARYAPGAKADLVPGACELAGINFCNMAPHLTDGHCIKGLIGSKSVVGLIGAAGSGKTFLAGDLAVHLAAQDRGANIE